MDQTYVYIRSEPGLWTVGFYRPDGEWEPESDHGDREEAAGRVRFLNGGQAAAPATLDLIALTEADDAFEQCIVCGGEAPTHFGLFVTESSNAPHRAAWCGEDACQKDRAQSMLQTVPVEKTGDSYRVSVAAAERELRAARRDRAERVRSAGDGIRDRLHAIAESLDA
jgi:hypothetical protein